MDGGLGVLVGAALPEPTLQVGVYLLGSFYFVARAVVRYYAFRSQRSWPRFLQTREMIGTIDFLSMTALILVAFFLMFNWKFWQVCLVLAALIFYDLGVRSLFLHLATRRLCAGSKDWDSRTARQHLTNRPRTGIFR